MKSRLVPLAALVGALAACDAGPKVVVRAELPEGPVSDLPVRLLPYDRDELLDSLRAAAKAPEPPVPPELVLQLQALEAGEGEARARGDTALARWRGERRVLFARADSVRRARQQWADRAFARFDTLAAKRREAADQDEAADTTDAAGTATFGAEPGRWWVTARYTLPYSELYWNLPVEVAGDSTVVRLTRANAKERPSL